MGLFGKSKADKAEEERERVRLEQQQKEDRIARETEAWVDAVAAYRNGSHVLTSAMLHVVGEVPHPDDPDGRADYIRAAETAAHSRRNAANIRAQRAVALDHDEEKAKHSRVEYNFWLSVDEYLMETATTGRAWTVRNR